jgi:hypothetical protein
MLYRMCLNDADKSDCEHILNASARHDAAECAELAKAPMRTFCAAVAQADTTKCDSLEVSDLRSMCAAFASDDPSHCPVEEGHDCVSMTRSLRDVEGQTRRRGGGDGSGRRGSALGQAGLLCPATCGLRTRLRRARIMSR